MNTQISIPVKTDLSFEMFVQQAKSTPVKMDTVRDRVSAFLKWRRTKSKLLILIAAVMFISLPEVNFSQAPDRGSASCLTSLVKGW